MDCRWPWRHRNQAQLFSADPGRAQSGYYLHSFPGRMADTYLQGTMTMPASLTHVGRTDASAAAHGVGPRFLRQCFWSWLPSESLPPALSVQCVLTAPCPPTLLGSVPGQWATDPSPTGVLGQPSALHVYQVVIRVCDESSTLCHKVLWILSNMRIQRKTKIWARKFTQSFLKQSFWP